MDYRKVKGIVVDAGHGGDDPGASGNGIIEKDYTLRAARYMYDRFKQLGLPVTLTRDSDETLSKKERVNRILNAYGNDPNVIVISNHINAGGGDGAEVIYALRNNDTLAKKTLEEIGKKGQNMRKYYQRRLPEDTSKDYYFIHRETGNTQPILVEYGFLDSTKDDVSQLKNNILDYAEAVVKAVAEYTGTPYFVPGENYYTVKKGDSLWLIANNYGITVDELKKANNLTSNTLTIGQNLLIPTKNETTTGTTYTVKKGDSLWLIANNYGITVNELKSANNLTSNVLTIGQQLIIPSKTTGTTTPSGTTTKYTVKSGDSLWNIAKKYNITVQELKDANNLTSNLLSIGQTLIIPSSTTGSTKTYTVKKGDSLWKIANSFNTTVDDIVKLNNLTNTTLSIGQTLLIPN